MGYFDGQGYYRQLGEAGYDAKGYWRSYGEGGYDYLGYFRRSGEGGYDSRGYYRRNGEGGYDFNGYYRSPSEGWSIICLWINMKYIIIIAIVIVAVTVIAKVFFSKSNNYNSQDNSNYSSGYSQEYINYYNSVNKMSYQQLEKMHKDLLPLCKVKLIFGTPNNNGIPQMIDFDTKNAEMIPENEQIYGCQTYGQAHKLNTLIVDRLDEFEK